MTLEEKLNRVKELIKQRDDIDQLLNELFGTAETVSESPKPNTRTFKTGRGRINPEVKEAIIADYKAGMKTMDILKKYNVASSGFYYIVKGIVRDNLTDQSARSIKEYQCLNCGRKFKSNLPKLDAYCPSGTCNKTTELEEVK